MSVQANENQGQEPGSGGQGQGQESSSQQGQQGNGQQGGTGQEPGQQAGGQQGGGTTTDISTMSEADLRTYAAGLQKDAQEARREAANYRTQHQTAQQALTEAQRAQMTEQERRDHDLAAAQSSLQEREARIKELETNAENLTRGVAVQTALASAGALNPVAAFKVGTWDSIKLGEDGSLDAEATKAAIAALKQSDPYLFRRTATADAGAGGGGAPEGGSSINDFVRGSRGR